MIIPRLSGYAQIWWSKLEVWRQAMNLSPILDWEEMKDVMRTAFVPDDYELELYKKFQGWKIISTMTVREYTKESSRR